jgi:hypothetical protein
MADLSEHPDTGDDSGFGPHSEPVAPTPRWKVVAGIGVGVVVVVLLIVLHLTGVLGPGAH